jgi:hypothetical protein
MRGTIEVGGHQAECVIEAAGNVWTILLLPTWESTEVLIGAVPRGKAKVTDDQGEEFDGQVIITDREDYVTQVEINEDDDRLARYEEEN